MLITYIDMIERYTNIIYIEKEKKKPNGVLGPVWFLFFITVHENNF